MRRLRQRAQATARQLLPKGIEERRATLTYDGTPPSGSIVIESNLADGSPSTDWATTFLGNPPYVWPHGKVTMVLKLGGASAPLVDGNTSWDSVAGFEAELSRLRRIEIPMMFKSGSRVRRSCCRQ